MLKVIIADDEARVCSLIRMLIDWDALNMELVGVAANGLEALDLIKSRDADILITDIRMPGCNGLTLIERAKAIKEQLEIIIISGYAHFEYAQSAIRFGVSDYLLKPINQQVLMDTLEKLAKRCRSRRNLGNEVAQLRRSSEENEQQLQSRLMRDLLAGDLKDTTEELLWKRYRFRMADGCHQITLLKMDYDVQNTSPTSLRIVEEKAAQAFTMELSPVCHTLMIHMADGLGGVLVGYSPEQRDTVRKKIRLVLNQLQAQRTMLGGFEFSAAVGGVMTEAAQLEASCGDVHLLLQERLTQGTGRILEKMALPSDWKQDELLRPYRQAIMELTEVRSTIGLAAAIRALDQEVGGRRNMRGADVYELVRSAGHVFLLQPQIDNGKEKYERFVERIAHIGRISALFEALHECVIREATELLEKQHSAEARPVRLARDYVHRHYGEAITLEKVCEEVGFSVSYFSALFKKETGENFVRYLTRIRMERAKELLAQTNLPVSEICMQVGYSDLKYFTQTFKKETSLSPGQYRKLYG